MEEYSGGYSLEGWPIDQMAGWLCSMVGPRQPLQGLAEARWVLADFGGLFGLVQGPIFNPKEVGTQVQYTVNQTKEFETKRAYGLTRVSSQSLIV